MVGGRGGLEVDYEVVGEKSDGHFYEWHCYKGRTFISNM